ncbi:protein of unknown function [Candidatus Nitrosocaldus cavascurensis]|uniref:Uncharacterized protein n=1 Tax=Candidatus Nitrosocaldus cavascurensis TaxID=2058097 RepID=A0A2K5AT65_9ARCH|nr:protein of unknown function [Candidatus Nitrosocaldus cavascurensis]
MMHHDYGYRIAVCGRRLAWSRISAFQAGDAGSNPADRILPSFRILVQGNKVRDKDSSSSSSSSIIYISHSSYHISL